MGKTTNKCFPEVRERGVRTVREREGQYESRRAAVVSISSKVGCAAQTLNEWVKKAEIDSGQRAEAADDGCKKLPNRAIPLRSGADLIQGEGQVRGIWMHIICAATKIEQKLYFFLHCSNGAARLNATSS